VFEEALDVDLAVVGADDLDERFLLVPQPPRRVRR